MSETLKTSSVIEYQNKFYIFEVTLLVESNEKGIAAAHVEKSLITEVIKLG
jgi:hypothetical protein